MFHLSGSHTWKFVTHVPPVIPGRKLCQFICSCTNADTLETPEVYNLSLDPGEKTALESHSEAYQTVKKAVEKGVYKHKISLDPVETQFSWFKILPNLHWQPCCNGTFPFNCNCVDEKFEVSV